MSRFRRIIEKLNLKYVFREILLIFIGISLAISFNNWNSSLQSSRNKKIVIERVMEEIQANLKELLRAKEVNQRATEGYYEYSKYYGKNSNEVIATLDQMRRLQIQYPSYFKLKDSIQIDDQKWKYSGGTYLDLELVELTEIAWKTAQSLSVANEFNYDCLYELESTYNLQSKVKNGFDRVANALGDNEDIRQIIRWLQIVNQLEIQLEKDYNDILLKLEECR